MKIALLQLNSTADMQENIRTIGDMVARAAAGGAEFIATPENSFLMEASSKDRILYTQDKHPGILAAKGWAKQYGIWLLIGSAAVIPEPGAAKCYNRSLLISPEGEVVTHYDKIHLFDVDVPGDRAYRESDRILGANKLAIASALGANFGLSICYDVRFPQLYRALAKAGASVLFVPAAFTAVTGEAHWHVLLRARAIENGCFVVAPAQTGTHAEDRKTYGHSLVVDPWGTVLADGGTGTGIITCEIDLAEVEKVRARIPSLMHDREFS
jgi:predicted amidohydrolase